jgi:hypothetical protein
MVQRLLLEPPPPSNVVAEGRARLLGTQADAVPTPGPARPTRPIRRAAFRSALGLGLAAAIAAAALVVATFIPGAGTAPGDKGPAVTSGSARSVLLAAAVRAESASVSGTYWHLRTMTRAILPQRFGHGGNRYTLEQLRVHEKWAKRNGQAWAGDRTWVRPATPKDEAAWRRDGAPSKWCMGHTDTQPPKPNCLHTVPGTASLAKDYFPFEVSEGLNKLTFRQLQRLPEHADALRARLIADARAHLDPSASAEVVNQNVANELADLLVYLPVPPGVRAAAYRALADMPGVTSTGPTRDELGRHGVGIDIAEGKGNIAGLGLAAVPKPSCSPRCTPRELQRNDAKYAREITRSLIIDPDTSHVLADKMIVGKSSVSDTLILRAGWTNEKPHKPSLP